MKLSLRSLITIPLIAQVVVVTAVTGWLAHRNGQAAVEVLAYQLLDNTGEHLNHKLATYTAIPPLVTQENKDALDLQHLDIDNLDSWSLHLRRQIQRFPDVTYIYYGDADGRYVSLSRLSDGRLKFAVKDDSATDAEVLVAFVADDGSLLSPQLDGPYVPQDRPWYQTAIANNQATWTDVYDFADPSPTSGISFVRPYIDSDNNLQGVLGTDFTLEAVETFIERIQTSESSATFLMDANGKVLASSTRSSSAPSPENSSAEKSRQQSLIQTTIDHVLNKLESSEIQEIEQQFKFRIRQENYWIQVTPFANQYGLQWLGVSLLSEADFTQQIRINSRNTIFLCLLAMGVSSAVSILIARRINRPIQKLGIATQSIGQNNATQSILPSPIKEFNPLIDSFNRMAKDLRKSRSQLQIYSQQLEKLVDQRTESLRQSEETFSKAFQASPNAITLSTLEDGRYIKVNDRFVDLMGLPREEIIGRTSTELNVWIPPKTRDVFYQELTSGRLRNQEWQVRNALGVDKTVLLSAEVICFKKAACVLVIANDISDRIIEREQLRQSEERWQLALKGNNDGIWDWNIAAGEIFYSTRWKTMLGYDNCEISNHKDEWEQRLHPQDRDRVLRSTQAHLDQKSSFFSEEYRLRCKDGSYKWILDRGQALWDEQGTPIRMVGSHTDISDRKHNEATMQEQEQFLRSIYNGVATGIFVIDVLGYRQFRYVDSNPAVERMSGAQRLRLIDSTPEELFPPDTAIEIINKYQSCVDKGETFAFEEQLFINNKWSWWLTTLTPLKDQHDQSYRLIGTTLNITLRKNAEEELAQQVQRIKLLASINNQVRQSLEPAQTYQTTVDQIGDAFGASRCCLHIYTELPRRQLTTVAEYLVPEYQSRWDMHIPLDNNAYIETVLAQDKAVVSDDVAQTPLLEPLSPLWEQLSIKSMLTIRTSYQGKPNGMIEVHQCNRQRPWQPWEVEMLESVADQVGIAIAQARLLAQAQTQQAELTRQNIALETAKQEAEQASQVKGDFLANMSHELRTPLNAIIGFTQIMQRTLKYEPLRFQHDSAKHLQVIQTSGDHLLTLINEVLDMAKIEAGQINLNRHPFDLHNLVRSLQTMFQPKAIDKGLQLTCDYGPEVPQYIETDEAKLRQILINLLGNAIKFTEQGNIQLSIHGVDQLHIEVSDTGKGIAAEQLDHIFEAFYQTDSDGQSQSGTGLGLAISKTYAELLEGTLSAESTPSQGSILRLQLPVTPADHLEQDHAVPQPPVVIHLAPNQPQYRILVVEDKWASRTLLVQLLTPVGFEVREAANGKEAIQIFEAWQPHLIWMDMRMPVMDGYEATQHIRSSVKGQAVAIIALTASALESERQVILSAGCDDFVRKPFQEQTIFSKLQEHLGAQYIYDDRTAAPTAPSFNHQYKNVAIHLSQQSQPWLSQLHSASSLADSEWVLQLIDALPSNETELATALRNLVKGFRCDLIEELAVTALKNEYPK